jgi:hypothetical protein
MGRAMSHTALVKFAPIFTLERFNDPAWTRPGRTLYERNAFQLMPGAATIPLRVDHDREIGKVEGFATIDWVDRPWIYARAMVTARPCWLQRGARASFQYRALHRREVSIGDTSADVVVRAFVDEVSVLAPGTEPASLGQRYCSSSDSHRRRYRPPIAPSPLKEIVNHPPGTIVRHGIGQVLGVR